MKTLSCGVLVINPDGELLLCRVTAAWHWDIPKGATEPGELPLAAALRETREECGLDLSQLALTDLGHTPYLPRKDLHLYAVLVNRFDAASCHCESHYSDRWGRSRPEMDGYEWTPFDRVRRRCAHHMGDVLTQVLSLHKILAQLQAQSGPVDIRPIDINRAEINPAGGRPPNAH